MGVVHLAYDRLTQQTVALKQVEVSPERLAFMSRAGDETAESLRLSLAREFQTLASLRHPHIISVLDYGFDADRQPFYTMSYLPGAQTIVEAARGLALEGKIELVQQLLQALAYLHRRQVLHRDLKPENVLVVEGVAQVLDFGLAVKREESSTGSSGGSAAYMAPELWLGQPAQEATDLYAVGVILYELLSGRHPFAPVDASLIYRVLQEEPALDLLNVEEGLAQTVGRLLAKSPENRFKNVSGVLNALSQALGRPSPPETRAIRESYLQAAAFVGREKEMGKLTEALERAAEGQGSIWLVGGESGVGKSRLLEEVRARALVAGWQVLAGQTEADGGVPYQLWQEIIPRLVLNTALSDLELGVLRRAAPGVDKLLAESIPEPPALSGEANQQRLVLTMMAVLQRQTQPTLLLLEDLQWANESLAPIKQLLKVQGQMPGVMVLATFRDDERPDLPTELAGSRFFQLKRLSDEQIAKLGRAMLGERATTPQIISLLVQETEGNTFFIVEVMRALAEEAGQLNEVGSMDLPTDVLTSGMKHLLQRRIQRVPVEDQPLLQLAAVSGRLLDLSLLKATGGTTDVAAWLQRVSETAVLSVRENQWLFAHDKLREAILVDLSDEKRRQLHRQVAEAIETIYPDNKAYYESLMEHWHQAGELAKEVEYLPLATTEIIYMSGSYGRVSSLLNRGLALLPENDPHRLNLLGRQIYTLVHTGKIAEAQTLALETLASVRKQHDQPGLALILYHLGVVKTMQGSFDEAEAFYEESLSIYEAIGNDDGLAKSFNSFGSVAHFQGQLERARDYYQKALAYYRAADDQHNVGRVLSNLSLVAADMNDYDAAENYLQQGLDILMQIGDKVGTAGNFINLGFVQLARSKATAQKSFYQALAICQNTKLTPYTLEIMVGLAWLYEGQREPVRAAELAGLAQHHPAHNSDIKWRLSGLPEKLAESLEPDELDAALERGRALDLNRIVKELLED